MIVCPNCTHQNYLGAIFCEECGAQLVLSDGTTQSLKNRAGVVPAKVLEIETGAVESAINDAAVTLHFIESGQTLPLSGKQEYILGRPNLGHAVQPDIDLTIYHAYQLGVSRLHARLKIQPSAVTITDLGTVNGTRVNGLRLQPHVEQALKHGDMLILGKLQIQTIIRLPAEV